MSFMSHNITVVDIAGQKLIAATSNKLQEIGIVDPLNNSNKYQEPIRPTSSLVDSFHRYYVMSLQKRKSI
jgi:hypothetical protein